MTISNGHPELARRMRFAIWLGWIIPCVGFVLIALLLPQDVLERWPAIATVSTKLQGAASGAAGGIDLLRHARSTQFDQVATVASSYAVLWWVWTVAFTFALSLVARKQLFVQFGSHGFMGLLKLLVAMAITVPLCFVGFFGLPGDPGFAPGLTANSRLGYAFMGTICVVYSSMGFGFAPIVLGALVQTIKRTNANC